MRKTFVLARDGLARKRAALDSLFGLDRYFDPSAIARWVSGGHQQAFSSQMEIFRGAPIEATENLPETGTADRSAF